MKSDTYDVKVAITKNDLMTCSCTCRAGSIDEEQIVCVHILPVLFQMTQILYFGMSQHILVEMANCLNSIQQEPMLTSNNEQEKFLDMSH
jgi:SWIM zinc finger